MLAALYLVKGCEERGRLVSTPEKWPLSQKKTHPVRSRAAWRETPAASGSLGAMAEGLRRCLRGTLSVERNTYASDFFVQHVKRLLYCCFCDLI